MKNAIIYDFDKTIYKKETSLSFAIFYLKRHPKKAIKFIKSLAKIPFLLIKKNSLKNIKNIYFDFLLNENKTILEKEINIFWKRHQKYFFKYFFNEIKKNKKNSEVLILISASPDFLLKPIYKKLGFDILIATNYDDNFNIIGENCKGSEKVKRLNKKGNFNVISFYSDSMSDKLLFDLAKNKFSVDKKGNLKKGYPKKNGVIDKWI